MPPIAGTATIDGYTQPGASPNTLANGDNAKILIEIDGTMDTQPGGSGLYPFDCATTTVRGFVLSAWNTPGTAPNGDTLGAAGLFDNCVSGYIEGNFMGTDFTGTVAKPDLDGIGDESGGFVAGTPTSNVVGGTTPQARNILSGNSEGGIGIFPTSTNLAVEGNYIGTDVTGTKALGYSLNGIGLTGGTVIVGGTLPGAGNLISGSNLNVDINDLLNQGQAHDDLVQGNLIGTDLTGQVALPGQGSEGLSIETFPTNMLIVGTTPAARNIISGNSIDGLSLIDTVQYNQIQGNYIGLDVTGTKALPNGAQGVISGVTAANVVPSTENTVGGAVPGAGNVISGNEGDGIAFEGTASGVIDDNIVWEGNTFQGNLIGTDATGVNAIPNFGYGIDLLSGATNYLIGGSNPGEGNLIANNGAGVVIDPGAPQFTGTSQNNNTIGNTILNNGGTGVWIKSGTQNLISRNSIFGNGGLGIALGNGGPNINTPCNATNAGANNLQNAPMLTAGSGTAFITATATDSNGNTSQFSNAVPASLSGNLLSLLGTFNSLPSTTYTIEFFSSPVADASGFGQGQTYLDSTTVTTAADCTASISNPVTANDADMSVTLSFPRVQLVTGPDLGLTSYSSVVTNNGPATAHNVVYTDALPAGLEVSDTYCNLGTCQSPITTSLGSCSVSGTTVTCTLGTMASGTTAEINIPVQATTTGSITNTVTVVATETDPNLANNTASDTETSNNPFPVIDHFTPTSVLVGNSGASGAPLTLTVWGLGFLPSTTLTFGGTQLSTTFFDNQICGPTLSQYYCRALQAQLPASMLATTRSPVITVTNPGPGGGTNTSATDVLPFTIASSCNFDLSGIIIPTEIENIGTNLIPLGGWVYPNDPSCSWTASSTVPWAVMVDGPLTGPVSGTGYVAFSFAPNTTASSLSGSITVAEQAFSFAEDPSSPCSYSLDSSSASYPASGGSGTINVTIPADVVNPGTCDAIVTPQVSWITVPQTSGLLTQSGPASYSVAANQGGPRTGTMMVSGAVFTLTQAAPSCFFTLSTNSGSFPKSASMGSFDVTTNDAHCAWTATSSALALLSITSGSSGTGNGTVSFSVPANSAGPQTATITVGNQTANATYTMSQASAAFCTFTLSSRQ